MESTAHDDSRKKRDSTDVVEKNTKQCEEKTKKLRAASQLLPDVPHGTDTEDVSYQHTKSTIGCALDLEVSLQRIVQLEEKDESKEYLSKTKWVQFRVGHASDASTLANFYRKSNANKLDTGNNVNLSSALQKEDTSLEVRLAEGLGNEDSPPSIYALLADVACDDDDNLNLLGAAVVSSGWETSRKVIMVKMFYVSNEEKDSDIAELLERRMWLRLSALALVASSEMIIDKSVTK